MASRTSNRLKRDAKWLEEIGRKLGVKRRTADDISERLKRRAREQDFRSAKSRKRAKLP